ncbi:MAG: substrate-binding domain-containing protein [Chthoniobacterales bacterium]
MQKRQRIYAMLSSSDFDRCIYENISDYLSENAPEIEVNMELDYLNADLARTSIGIITRIIDAKDHRIFRSYGCPVVNISATTEGFDFPSVCSDSLIRGRIVAEHLLSRRFHHFGYYGSNYSIVESKSFEQTIRAAGFESALHLQTVVKPLYGPINATQQRNLRNWVKTLPKPIGIFCATDPYAWELSKVCDTLNLTVGRDVGIVGCGNHEFFCKTCKPQLSSVENCPDRIGYEAAALLVRLINGEPPPPGPILIPPTVIARASSDIFVTEDSFVAAAIQYIQQHINSPLPPQEIFNHIPLSRAALERRFRKQLDYSVLETIHLLKIEQIKHLLISTSKSMDEIASAYGFSSAPNMTTLFREKVGATPSEYRRRFLKTADPAKI